MHTTKRLFGYLGVAAVALVYTSCSLPSYLAERKENKSVPSGYTDSKDSTNSGRIQWKTFFKDQDLASLIDLALKNNQELNIRIQEIYIAQNEARARKGAYLPFLWLEGGAGVERSARYTRNGAVDATTNIAPGQPTPDPLPNYLLAANVSWELDIWKKLRNSRKAAIYRYMATTEGRNFMMTQLVAEIANSYYELLALDNQLDIVKQNIEIQTNALEIVKLEKLSTRVTELAVRKFEAEVFHTRSLQFDIQQQIIVAENRINFLVGRFPQPVQRNFKNFMDLVPDSMKAGVPSQLLQNRPDVRQAEQGLAATKLDVKAAKAQFYPSLNIMGGVGYQAFNPKYLVTTPASLLYTLAGDLIAPLVNRNAIKAEYYSASARQIQAAFNYERTILNAYIEVANQISNISNLQKSFELKSQQVNALMQSINISTGLFKSARADYMEVLMTQRDALESRFELVETKMHQMNAMVNIYQALGGGWR